MLIGVEDILNVLGVIEETKCIYTIVFAIKSAHCCIIVSRKIGWVNFLENSILEAEVQFES